MRQCEKCGKLDVYFGQCDTCWERTLMETMVKHADAIAARETDDATP